ncbi:MAG TPA: exonuclease domain-containing protein [Verrucomicrobiae bacterium]|nr:exonuclease domain-containing protein [Verrucomicrobiae bacterium]
MASPLRPLAACRLVVFDTETTGLSAVNDRVLEIAAVSMENGAETGRFESLVDPGIPIPPEISAIHGITDEMVRDQPSFGDAARRFLEFAGDDVLAAHNAPYDVSMMLLPSRAAGLAPRGNPVLDTHRLARRLLKAPRYALGPLAASLGIAMPIAHRAMADVVACVGVLKACLAALGPHATLADAEKASASRLAFGAAPEGTPALPDRLAALAASLGNGAAFAIVYRSGSKGDAPRPVTPLFLLEIAGELNLAAECHIDRSSKNFIVDRIASARPFISSSGPPSAP